MKRTFAMLLAVAMFVTSVPDVNGLASVEAEEISTKQEMGTLLCDVSDEIYDAKRKEVLGREQETKKNPAEKEHISEEDQTSDVYENEEDVTDERAEDVLQTSEEGNGVYTSAEGTLGENMTWSLSEGVLSISGQGDMTIPWEGAPWKQYKGEIHTINIADGITSVGSSAFSDHAVSSVSIPNSVCTIASYAFNNCNNLETVHLPDNVSEIQNNAFSGCQVLSTINIPLKLSKCGTNIFGQCPQLICVALPEGMQIIPENLFYGAKGIQDVTFATSLREIGQNAFRETGISSVDLSEYSIEYIGDSAFAGCEQLEKFKFPKHMKTIPYGVFRKDSLLCDVTLPDDVECIGESAFYSCKKLTEIRLPKSVTEIKNYAFEYSGLLSVDLSEYQLTLGEYVFDGTKITSIAFPENMEVIPTGTCDGCQQLSEIVYPLNVKTISKDAFYGCTSLVNVKIPETVTQIGANAFAGCTSLERVTLSSNWESAGTSIFKNCKKLTSIEIPEELLDIPDNAFDYANYLEQITFSGKQRVIGKGAFENCKSLNNVCVPNSVTQIDERAFYSCDSLHTIDMGNGVEKIGDYAFGFCQGLETVRMPASWTVCTVENGSQASIFGGCRNLVTIILPKELKVIPDYAFCNASSLRQVIVEGSEGTVSPEADINSIGTKAFWGCENLVTFKVPNKVTSIGKDAFAGCKKLLVINVPQKVKEMPMDTLAQCENLKKVNYMGSDVQWSQIKNIDGTESIVPTYSVSCHFEGYDENVFLGVWDGERTGFESSLSSFGSQLVPRHCVLAISECEPQENGLYALKGVHSFSKSKKTESSADSAFATGSYTMQGTVDGTTGYVNLWGEEWIDLPAEGDWGYTAMEGVYDDTGDTIVGYSESETDRPFSVTKLLDIDNGKTQVVMQDAKGKKYDLLKDNVSVNASDRVSIYIKAGFGEDANVSNVKYRVKQSKNKMENEGGNFLDIYPAKEFRAGEPIYIEIVDEQGVTLYYRKLTLTIGSNHTNKRKALIDASVQVYQNKLDNNVTFEKMVSSPGVMVTYNDGTEDLKKETSSGGVVKMKSAQGDISFEKQGYISRTITTDRIEKNDYKVYLQKASTNAPVVSAVWANDLDIVNHGLTEKYYEITSKTKCIELEVEVDWGANSYGKIQILQEGDVKYTFSSGSVSESKIPLDKVDVENLLAHPMYIQATDSAGHSVKKKLFICNHRDMDFGDINIEFTDSQKFTLPDSAGVLAGTQVEIDELNLPYALVMHDGKFTVGIGYIDSKSSETTVGADGSREKQTEVEDFVSTVKSFYADEKKPTDKETTKFWKNLKDRYSGVKTTKSSYGFTADVNCFGYIEGTYDEGTGKIIDITGNRVTVMVGVGASQTFPFTIGPVPCFFELTESAETKADLEMQLQREVQDKIVSNVNIQTEMAVTGAMGVGINDVANIKGGVKGTLETEHDIQVAKTQSFEMVGSLNCWASCQVACFTYSKDFDPIAKKTFISYPKSAKNAVIRVEEFNANLSALMDTDAYELIDLTYIDSKQAIALKNGSDVLRENAYRSAQTQVITLNNGNQVMVWQDVNSTDFNKIQLYYSIYDGTSWSTPAIVSDDGTMDFAPQIATDGSNVYVVWQNATKSFDEKDASLANIASYVDITVATLKDGAGSFTSQTMSVDNIDLMPELYVDSQKVYVAWVNNANNSWFADSNNNSIYVSENVNDAWSTPKKSYENLNRVNSIAVDYQADDLKIAYSVDADNNAETENDNEVYENGEKVYGSDGAINVSYNNHKLYWLMGGKVANATMDITVISEEAIQDYKLFADGDQQGILYTVSNGEASMLKLAYFNVDTGAWGQASDLTDGKGFIDGIDVTAKDGNLFITYVETEVVADFESGQNPYGSSTIKKKEIEAAIDVEISDIQYDVLTYSNNEPFVCSIDVTNKGTTTISSENIAFIDENGEILETEEREFIIVPNDTVTISTYYTPKDIVNKSTTIRLTAKSGTKNVVKEITMDLSVCDAEVTDARWCYGADNNIVVSANIYNYSDDMLSGAKVSLVEGAVDGTVLQSVDVEDMNALDVTSVDFCIDANAKGVYYIVLAHEEDQNTGNNDDFVNVNPKEEAHQWNEGVVIKQATCVQKGVTRYTCVDCGVQEEVENLPLNPNEHVNTEIRNKVTAQVTRAGYTGDKYCKDCGVLITKGKVTPSTGSYTIAFNSNGGKSGSMKPMTKRTFDQKYTLTKNAFTPNTGYYFAGWNTKKDGTGTSYADQAVVKNLARNNGQTVTLFAQWKKVKYTIAFNGNGNTSGTMKQMNCYYGSNYNLSANSFTRKGYTFNGWNTRSDGTGTKYANKAAIKNLSSSNGRKIALYAQWKYIKYSITYNLNRGTNNSKNPVTYTVNTSTISLQNPSRRGCSFLGWYSDSSYKNKVTQITKGTIGNKTLYAKWSPVKYKIVYNLNGGTNNSKNPVTYTVNTSTITLQNPSRKGYTFAGWYSDSSYKNKVTQIAKGTIGNKTLYAKWTANRYTVSFHPNGGKGTMKDEAFVYGSSAKALTANAFKRSGYTFVGWATNSDNAAKQIVKYKNRQKVSNLTTVAGKRITLYAVWVKNTQRFTITYNMNGGVNASANPKSYTVVSNTITLVNPEEREGYTFEGWYSDSAYKTRVVQIIKGSFGNKTLYAKWTENSTEEE